MFSPSPSLALFIFEEKTIFRGGRGEVIFFSPKKGFERQRKNNDSRAESNCCNKLQKGMSVG